MKNTETKTTTEASKSGSRKAKESRAIRTMGFVRDANVTGSVSAFPATGLPELHPSGLSYRSLIALMLRSINTADNR